MKKRILCIVFAALFACLGAGCSGGDVIVSLDETKPWQKAGREVCEYKITKTYENDTVVAEGSYVQTIETLGEETTVTNEFSLTYGDVGAASAYDTAGYLCLNNGLTDTYVGSATFKKDSLEPIRASKDFRIAQRPLCGDGKTATAMPAPETENLPDGIVTRYTLSSNPRYGDPRGYAYTADYASAHKATFTTTKPETREEQADGATVYQRDYRAVSKEIGMGSNARFDNEQLGCVVRALSATKKNSSATFYLSNIYDSYIRNDDIRYTMSVSCDKNTTPFPLSAEKFRITDTEGELEQYDGNYSVACVKVSISLSSSTPGPAITMYVTDPSYVISLRGEAAGTETNKLIVQMQYLEYSMSSASIAYQTTYSLVNYTH